MAALQDYYNTNLNKIKETSQNEEDPFVTVSRLANLTCHSFTFSVTESDILSSPNVGKTKKTAPLERTGFEPAFPRVTGPGVCQLTYRPAPGLQLHHIK